MKPSGAKRSAYPFSLLLSSCREKENSVATIHYYRKEGVTPYIVQTDLGGKGKWWRTLSGSYKTLETALQAKKSLRLPDAIVVKTPYANLVGEFPSEREASEQSVRLNQSGLFPYMVHEPGQPVQLLVGAFRDRQAAEQYQRELDAKGIASHVILR
jgi:cell division septation protein DedD